MNASVMSLLTLSLNNDFIDLVAAIVALAVFNQCFKSHLKRFNCQEFKK
jgi:hypothetical protein